MGWLVEPNDVLIGSQKIRLKRRMAYFGGFSDQGEALNCVVIVGAVGR